MEARSFSPFAISFSGCSWDSKSFSHELGPGKRKSLYLNLPQLAHDVKLWRWSSYQALHVWQKSGQFVLSMRSKSCFALHRPASPWNQFLWRACRCSLSTFHRPQQIYASIMQRILTSTLQNGMNSVPNTWTRTVLHLTSACYKPHENYCTVTPKFLKQKRSWRNKTSTQSLQTSSQGLWQTLRARRFRGIEEQYLGCKWIKTNLSFLSCQLGSKIAHSRLCGCCISILLI